jgi:hypothetical protein
MAMTWEYFTHVIPSRGMFTSGFDAAELSNALNWYGGQGWELVSTFVSATNGYSNHLTLIFKRPGTIAAAAAPP